jgi:hypothetical protein
MISCCTPFNSFASLALIMATTLEILEDNAILKSVTSPPSSVSLADSVHCTGGSRPSVLSLLRTTQKQTFTPSRIRDLVSAPGFTPSSVIPLLCACAAALSPPVFSHLLQTPNIQGHTGLYWVMNDRRKVFLHLLWSHSLSFICWLFRRLACMMAGRCQPLCYA